MSRVFFPSNSNPEWINVEDEEISTYPLAQQLKKLKEVAQEKAGSSFNESLFGNVQSFLAYVDITVQNVFRDVLKGHKIVLPRGPIGHVLGIKEEVMASITMNAVTRIRYLLQNNDLQVSFSISPTSVGNAEDMNPCFRLNFVVADNALHPVRFAFVRELSDWRSLVETSEVDYDSEQVRELLQELHLVMQSFKIYQSPIALRKEDDYKRDLRLRMEKVNTMIQQLMPLDDAGIEKLMIAEERKEKAHG